jgi:hypothetical protein
MEIYEVKEMDSILKDMTGNVHRDKLSQCGVLTISNFYLEINIS